MSVVRSPNLVRSRRPPVVQVLATMVAWYAAKVYGRLEGPGCLPFYCDPSRVGRFAVSAEALAHGNDAAVFRLFVTLTMYQSRRDVDIMAKQRAMPAWVAREMTEPRYLARAIAQHPCERLASATVFDGACDVVRKPDGRVSCGHRPRTPCHVKSTAEAIARMGVLGKLPTSAYLHLQATGGGFAALRQRVVAAHATPRARALAMCAAVADYYHVGPKLAAFFVSALATPALAPGLTPWFPELDGYHCLVLDANVRRVVARLRRAGAGTYVDEAAWLRRQAVRVPLAGYGQGWPATAPRLVQQAIYWYRSRANRLAHGLACAGDATCLIGLCPFHEP